MKAVFPGKPQAKLHALCTALWEGQRLVVYISNNTLIILNGPTHLLQTISHAESDYLEAVAISDLSGKIATCTATTVFIYRPVGHGAEDLRWALQHTLHPSCADSSLTCLSWGIAEEILASGSHLTLFHTDAPAHEVWCRQLANPAKVAVFTPDASFVASIGWHDRLVKIWQRVVVGEDDERENVSYLSHPSTVTGLRWHRRPDQDHHSDTVLYTTCADSKLRIWAATDHHALQPLQLWTEFDLTDCILPRNPDALTDASSQRFVFIVDGWEFEAMIEQAIHRQNGGERERQSREHLLDVAYRNPDICVVMDHQDNMSAWGLERVGCKARQPNDIFNILLAEHVNLPLPNPTIPLYNYFCLSNFAGINDGTLNVITNLFDGSVHWLSSSVDQFFDTASSSKRFDVDAIWTGPAEPIRSLISSTSCNALLSIGTQHELVLWLQSEQGIKATLIRKGTGQTTEPLSLACLASNGQFAVTVQQQSISLWDLRSSNFEEISTFKSKISSDFTCILPLQSHQDDSGELIAILGKSLEGSVVRVTSARITDHAPLEIVAALESDTTNKSSLDYEQFCAIKSFGSSIDAYVPIAYTLSSAGILTLWSFDVDITNKTCKPTAGASLDTQMKDSSSSIVGVNGKAVIVSSTRNSFVIWDTSLKHLEHVENFKPFETIESLDMTLTNNDQALLAVSISRKATVYAQTRYSFHPTGESWILIKTVDISQQTTMPISDCLWLSTHDLLLAAGNQMFLFEGAAAIPDSVLSSVDPSSQATSTQPLPSIVEALNAVPAVFTPELNAQVLASGKLEFLDLVFNKLRTKLKFWSPGDDLDSSLGLGVFECLKSGKAPNDKSFSSSAEHEAEDEKTVFSEDSATSLNEILRAIDLPFVSIGQQTRIGNLGESFAFFEKHRDSVDSLGVRYLVNLHHYIKAKPSSAASHVGFREISWAFHSSSQDILIDLTTRTCGGKMLWSHARESGMFLWINDIEAVRAQFEVIARNEYTKTDERNPIDCSLHYLALKKKQVLEGLWRLATWHRESKLTRRLLGNNFNEPRWKTAALKNAYALLSLRRFEYAAAFFLLADQPKDAVTILANQLKDIQLAIAVARVYEGDNGPVLQELLQETVLPKAAHEGDRWLSTWAYWMLHEKEKALRALTEPLENLITLPKPPPIESKHFRMSEPALVHHFSLLRDKCQQSLRQGISVHPRAEWDLVMRSAISYARAGCPILALDLVRNWKFSERSAPKQINGAEATVATGVTEVEQEAKLVDSLWNSSSAKEGKMGEEHAANKMNGTMFPERKKVVEEPSAASILDNFNF